MTLLKWLRFSTSLSLPKDKTKDDCEIESMEKVPPKVIFRCNICEKVLSSKGNLKGTPIWKAETKIERKIEKESWEESLKENQHKY